MMAGDISRGALWLLWRSISLPAFTFLTILEPVVRVVFASLALLGVLTAFFFKALHAPHFPFWLMLAISVAFALAVTAYHSLLRLFSK